LISANGQGDFITRKGYKVLQNENGLDLVQAEARIDVDLHPRIGDRVRSQFLLGEYSTAVLLVMREVEIRVLELVGPVDVDKENQGVRLMSRAFKPDGGLLCDSSADGGQQVGTMNLFQGAIGLFKNPVSHRQVDYANPTIASEVVLFADLLLRILDERAAEMTR
jgi:uncharacterized protein (TIGR02391 family)